MSSWTDLLIRLGEKCVEYGPNTDISTQIEMCHGSILRELDHSEDNILELLLQCFEELPHKSPYYATLVGLLNLDNEDFAKKVVCQIHEKLQNALENEQCDKIRILIRLLTVLMCSSVIHPGYLIEVFETLLSSAATTVDDDTGNPSWQARADFYIFCILASLPWGGLELYERVQDELERVMAGIEAYLRIRRPILETAFSPFVLTMKKLDSSDNLDFLEDLWGRIRSLREDEWKVNTVPRPYFDFEARLVTGKSHDVKSITCPMQPPLPLTVSDVSLGRQMHEAALKYPQRLQRLHMFSNSENDEIMKPIDRFVVEEYIMDVLLYLNGCRKECTAYLVGLPVPFNYDKILAETIFSQIFLLPKPRFKLLYYALVIIDLFKALPGAFPAVVADSVRWLFNRVGDLDMECRTRLVLWFSLHLSNVRFIWPWTEWGLVLDLPKWSPRRVFAQEVLEKEVRLSYWEKIKQSLEEAPGFVELLPPKENGPCFKYSRESQGEQSETELALAADLTNMVRDRRVVREIYTWVDENIVSVHGTKTAIELVVQTLVNIGSKTLTHLDSVLERYGHLISKLGSDHSNQVLIIDEISKLWKNNSQMIVITIDRMMGYRIVSNFSILKWVFAPSNIEQFQTSGRPWEILRNALAKTFNRISDLRKKVASAEEDVKKATDALAKVQAEVRSAEASAEGDGGQETQNQQREFKLKRLKADLEKRKTQENSAQEQLEANNAVLSKELQDTEALLVALYKNFSEQLMKHNLDTIFDSEVDAVEAENEGDSMAVDGDEPSPMDADDDMERRNQRFSKTKGAENLEEVEWCTSTLGQLQALTRQYATEIWNNIEKLDAEVFTESVHPCIRNAVYCSLRRSIPPSSDMMR